MAADFAEPLNLGQDRMVTINQLADIIADAAEQTQTNPFIWVQAALPSQCSN